MSTMNAMEPFEFAYRQLDRKSNLTIREMVGLYQDYLVSIDDLEGAEMDWYSTFEEML